MARIPQVTRTIKTTIVDVLCLNIVDGEPFNEQITLPRTYKDEKAMLKEVEKVINNDVQRAVHIVGFTVEEKLYGMSEQKFIETADELPSRKDCGKAEEETKTKS